MSTNKEDPIISRYESARELVLGPRTEHVYGTGLAKTGSLGHPPDRDVKLVTDRLPRKVKRHFLECELVTADNLIREYVDHLCDEQIEGYPEVDSNFRHKLIWLLERLQEEVL